MTQYQALPVDAYFEAKAESRLSPLVRLGPIADLECALADSWLDISRSTYRFLSLLREFDMRQAWHSYGCNDCAEWLDFKLKISRTTALEKVRVARALWFVPKIEEAFRDGKLSYSQVRAMTRVADKTNEDALLAYAEHYSTEGLERYCRGLRNADPAAAEREAKRQLQGRALYVHEASGEITVKLPPAELALVKQPLEQIVETLPDDPDRDYFAARADALVELARRGGSDSASSSNENYQVLVHVDADALDGKGGQSDLPTPTVKRLLCDGAVVPVIKQGDEVLNVGRKQRTVPAAIKRALAARDRACQFPGCHHTQFLDAHHIEHWCDGGETSLDNLVLLCSHHHRLVHEGGFRMKMYKGKYYFARPDGRLIEGPSSAEDGERSSSD